jgi:pimeloyl-ACP methyl ester carboxylesterase
MTEPTTHTLELPGAVLHYDVRPAAQAVGDRAGDGTRDGTADGAPVLLLFGSPMGAEGFAALADRFPDRTVVTYDPRGAGRSALTSDDAVHRSTPEQHGDDLHAIIVAATAERGGGPVDVLASSGGAVNALALVAAYPGDVGTLVAHEPPLARLVEDHEQALAACVAAHDAYQKGGFGAGMARFIALVSHDGPIPADVDAPQLAPDPAMFGLPTEDDGGRDDVLLGQNLISCTHFEPDLEALRASSTRIVVAVGADSGRQLARRGGEALAERLGTEPVVFPRDHGGFMGETSMGPPGDPDGFAAALRAVLAQAGTR